MICLLHLRSRHYPRIYMGCCQKGDSSGRRDVLPSKNHLIWFPNWRTDLYPNLNQFCNFRTSLLILDGVKMRINDRILIPRGLHQEVLKNLRVAHQGTIGMNERAKSAVFWSRITNDITETGAKCRLCTL